MAYTNSKQREHFSMEHRPQLLKDFLNDDPTSCSLSTLHSFGRRPCDQEDNMTTKSPIQIDLHSRNGQRPLSKTSSSTTSMFSFQAMINAIKRVPFAKFVKSPSMLLPEKKSPKKGDCGVKATITVKDIMRWRSFRDLMEENSTPFDFASTPNHCTGSTFSTPSGSSDGSSLCDSDFTVEYSPHWSGNPKEFHGNKKKNLPCVGGDPTEVTTETTTNSAVGPKEDEELACEDKEQHSPVSVLHFQFSEAELFSSIHQSLANGETGAKQRLMQKIQRFRTSAKMEPMNLETCRLVEDNTHFKDDHEPNEEEPNEVEYRARQLLNQVKATNSLVNFKDNVDQLLLDLFRVELSSKRDNEIKNDEFDYEMVRIAKSWLNGEHEHKRVVYAEGMDVEWMWSKFEVGQQELALEIANEVFKILVDELLVEISCC
ncbi:hypothetical protein CFOL_v3_33283 [Cephalotus follicularis]|uniref:DUF4378 domain-containing protein n=1 Tax=Cephalotus follicularis TaxID=3775 RepID=A0A1Q3DBM9_CEPFO|nr:hypothetical protein CFOL_v3_33283 [Cephalotus follicularis]